MFESLPNSVANVPGIMKSKPPTRALVRLEEQGQVMESKKIQKRRFLCWWRGWMQLLGQVDCSSLIVVAVTSVLHGRVFRYRCLCQNQAGDSGYLRVLQNYFRLRRWKAERSAGGDHTISYNRSVRKTKASHGGAERGNELDLICIQRRLWLPW